MARKILDAMDSAHPGVICREVRGLREDIKEAFGDYITMNIELLGKAKHSMRAYRRRYHLDYRMAV